MSYINVDATNKIMKLNRLVAMGEVTLENGDFALYSLLHLGKENRTHPSLPYLLKVVIHPAGRPGPSIPPALVGMLASATGAYKLVPEGTKWTMAEEN